MTLSFLNLNRYFLRAIAPTSDAAAAALVRASGLPSHTVRRRHLFRRDDRPFSADIDSSIWNSSGYFFFHFSASNWGLPELMVREIISSSRLSLFFMLIIT